MKQLAVLEEAMTPIGNYKNYRAIIAEINNSKPYIPIISLFLKDIFFSNDGNQTFTTSHEDKSSRLINIPKFEEIMGKIKGFCTSNQRFPVSKRDLSDSEDYFSKIKSLKEPVLYKYSLLCQAKNGDDATLRLREKWMNG
jgi:hypothetical protein